MCQSANLHIYSYLQHIIIIILHWFSEGDWKLILKLSLKEGEYTANSELVEFTYFALLESSDTSAIICTLGEVQSFCKWVYIYTHYTRCSRGFL